MPDETNLANASRRNQIAMARSRVGGVRFDISTSSALSPQAGYIAVVVDSELNTITVSSSHDVTGRPSVGFEGFSSAVALAREHLQPEPKMWQVFAGQRGGERWVGGLKTYAQPFKVLGLKKSTDAASYTPVRDNVVSVDAVTRETFGKLAKDWKQSRDRFDSGIAAFTHPSYQKIIGMGDRVLPLIFEELQRELDHWFWALKAITRAEPDPVPADDVGNLEAMRTHWLRWANERGYQWQRSSTSTRALRGASLASHI